MSESDTGVTAEAVEARSPAARICLTKVRILKPIADSLGTLGYWHIPRNVGGGTSMLLILVVLGVLETCHIGKLTSKSARRDGPDMWRLGVEARIVLICKPFGLHFYFRLVGRPSILTSHGLLVVVKLHKGKPSSCRTFIGRQGDIVPSART
jgi:hypothetical protein